MGLGVPSLVAVVYLAGTRQPQNQRQKPTSTEILSLVMKSVFTLTRTGIGGRMAAVFGVKNSRLDSYRSFFKLISKGRKTCAANSADSQ